MDTVSRPDGSEVQREVVEHADAVAAVALDARARVRLGQSLRPTENYI